LGWLAYLFPTVVNNLSLYIKVLGIVTEASLMLWLLVMGVNVQRWKEQAGAVDASIRTWEPASAPDLGRTPAQH
jgi:hypothetical protein